MGLNEIISRLKKVQKAADTPGQEYQVDEILTGQSRTWGSRYYDSIRRGAPNRR